MNTQTLNTDPVTLELIKNALESIVDDMALTLVRTAYSSVLKDCMDFSSAFADDQGRLVAQSLTIPLHLGAYPEALEAVWSRYGDNLAPGDIIVLNDPFEGGMHLPDIFMFRPVFWDAAGEGEGGPEATGREDKEGEGAAGGPELVGWSVVTCHHTDVGGRVAGSNACDSTEIYAEGLRIPPLKLYEGGHPNETLFRIIEKNVRVPHLVRGDLRAQLTACEIGAQSYLGLVRKYGRRGLTAALDNLILYAERMTRAEIARWPDGEYRFEDWIDDDGIDPDPIPIRVALTVRGDELWADFAGSAPQVKGAINGTLSFAKSTVYLAVRSALGADIPNNVGFFRPIHVSAPEASIVNARLPAAFAARGLTGYRMADCLFGALAQIVPERIPAAGEGGNTGVSIGGYHEDRSPFIYVEFVCGTGGARPDKDGIDGITNPAGIMCNVPAEVLERELPIELTRYELRPDSGGPGRYRGGLGLVREYRFTGREAVLQVRSDRARFAPYGLEGGGPGEKTRNTLTSAGGESRPLPSKVTMTIVEGDVYRHEQAGGGGYGDPLEREPEAVLEDYLDEKVSLGAAGEAYGVVIDAAREVVDEEATHRLRAERRSAGVSDPTPG